MPGGWWSDSDREFIKHLLTTAGLFLAIALVALGLNFGHYLLKQYPATDPFILVSIQWLERIIFVGDCIWLVMRLIIHTTWMIVADAKEKWELFQELQKQSGGQPQSESRRADENT